MGWKVGARKECGSGGGCVGTRQGCRSRAGRKEQGRGEVTGQEQAEV